MWIQFRYEEEKPLLAVQFVRGTRSFDGLGLVDSGAGMTLAHADIAKFLGIDEANCSRKPVGGIVGENANGFVCDVDLYVKYLPDVLTIPVLFVPNLRVGLLLGHDGFFDSYRIKFQKDSNFFEISRSPLKKYEKK